MVTDTHQRLLDAANTLALAASNFATALAADTATLSPTAAPPSTNADPVAKFGRNKGMPLALVSNEDLQWLAIAIGKSVADPSKAKYLGENERDLTDVRNEQAKRAAAPGTMPGRPLAADDSIPF